MRFSFQFSLIVLAALGTAFGQDTNFSTGPQYLMNSGSPMFARPISTPSLSLASPPLEVGASNATEGLIAGVDNQTASRPQALPTAAFDPIDHGVAPTDVIEISFTASPSRELPASIVDVGVWQVTTAQALRERGYGVTLGEASAYGKSHAGHATRVYTNSDIDRLHNGS